MGYSKKHKLKVLKHVDLGITPIEQVAQIRRIPKQTIYRWLAKRKMYGVDSLENRLPGTKEICVNETFELFILSVWHERQRSAHKLWLISKQQGFDVSERQIQKLSGTVTW